MEARAAAPAFRPAPRDVSRPTSVEPPLVFDDIPEEDPNDQYTEPTTGFGSGLEEQGSYDLKPPPPTVAHNNIETLAVRFFSVEHLNTILEDPALSARFSKFLHQYRAAQVPKLTQYFEAKKAQTAVAYANAVAEQISSRDGKAPYAAARLDERFEEQMRETVEALVEDALPAYVTHRLTLIATESLVKEITGNNAPIMRELIPSLAEVYCITDPSMPDNPIVYASQEFYNTSQYGKDYVLGRNCRFLQGPRTSNASVRRMIDALTTGQEITETILNYRRDGSPFMNLLLIAPLYDNKGNVRYFLGCQIDVSSLIDEGRGLESFATLLSKQRSESRYGDSLKKDPKHMLSEFGAALNEEEGNIIKNRTRSFSEEGVRPSSAMSGGGGSVRTPRRRLGMEDAASDRHLWPDTALGPSGRLPGVYQNYFLVRPYPSLRITFTSPALRIPGLLQTKFLDRIGGPESVREGLLESFAHGTGVTAKVTWLSSNNGGLEGKPRWIHCTPLLGSDEKVGVWMVVMVDNEEITGGLRRSVDVSATASVGAASPRFTGNKLYAEYLRREGRPGTAGTDGTSESVKERRDVDDRFRDF